MSKNTMYLGGIASLLQLQMCLRASLNIRANLIMPQRNLLTRLLGLSIACGCGVHSGTGRAADVSPPISTAPIALEEIVVSATKTNESIQRVPISITAYTQADLNASGAH